MGGLSEWMGCDESFLGKTVEKLREKVHLVGDLA
jgi:hypothetical protein